MKILLTVASSAASISGVQRHALNVARCLLSLPEISALHLVVAPWQRDFVQDAGLAGGARLVTHVAEIGRNAFSRNLWYYRGLPKLAEHLRTDLVHFSYPAPVKASGFHCPTVVTLHDLYPYEIPMNFGFPKFIFNRVTLRQCLRNVDAIACVSEATRARLKDHASAAIWRKAVRIYNCVDPQPCLVAKSPIPGSEGEPFLLCVAQHRRNKNIPLLLRTFNLLLRSGNIDPATRLFIIGMSGPETRSIRRLTARLGLERFTYFLEGLPEAELQWCYQHCQVLIATSITEGFGLPVAEGMLAGCRIVCSDIPAHREVGVEYCRFVALRNEPGADAERFAAGVTAALQEPRRKPMPLPHFSAPAIAKEYARLYRRMVEPAVLVRDLRLAHTLNIGASESQTL